MSEAIKTLAVNNQTENKENQQVLTKEQFNEFEKLAKPVIEFLNKLGCPYYEAKINTTGAEITIMLCSFPCEEYLID